MTSITHYNCKQSTYVCASFLQVPLSPLLLLHYFFIFFAWADVLVLKTIAAVVSGLACYVCRQT